MRCRTFHLGIPKRLWKPSLLRHVQGSLGGGRVVRPVGVGFPEPRHVRGGLQGTTELRAPRRAEGGLRRLERLVPLLHLLDGLAKVRRGPGDLGLAPSAPDYPGVPQELPRRHAQIRVFLKTLHEEVSRGLRGR